MIRVEDTTLAMRAINAAKDCLECNDDESAFEYLAVAVAALQNNPKPGTTLLVQTEDAHNCIQAGNID